MCRLNINKLWLVSVLFMFRCAAYADGTGTARESFFIELPGDGIAISHGGNIPLAAGPPGITLLTEPRVKDGLTLLAKVRNANNEVIGFASELETFPEGANLLKAGVDWDTSWTVMIPGRGSLYLHERETSGELGAKVVIPVQESGTAWHGDWTVTTTIGPRPDGYGVIVGGTGEFAGAAGKFQEIVTLTGFEPAGVMVGHVELRLSFN